VPLPSEKPVRRLLDIIENGNAILRYTEGMNAESFAESRLVYDAVERCLERISEAVAKLGDLAPALLPGQPCRDIRALGNRLRHNYDQIGEARLWEMCGTTFPH
jgi:uncharacterized protein with HEPN domain